MNCWSVTLISLFAALTVMQANAQDVIDRNFSEMSYVQQQKVLQMVKQFQKEQKPKGLTQRDLDSGYVDKAIIQKNLQKVASSDLFSPTMTDMTPGDVKEHDIKGFDSPYPFYVIGDDTRSVKWARKHAEDLKKIKAFGILVNVKDKSTLEQVQRETGLSLLTPSVNGIEKMLAVKHYPFLVYQGKVRQ